MSQLNDVSIRKSLILKLKNQAVRPKAIIEELRVHNGKAIADVVALYAEAHCFEIKGDGDKIERILKQGKYYNLSFRTLTKNRRSCRVHQNLLLQNLPRIGNRRTGRCPLVRSCSSRSAS